MREISTDRMKIGEHLLLDGIEYVAEEYTDCSECALRFNHKCHLIPCNGVVLKSIDEIPTIIEASKEKG